MSTTAKNIVVITIITLVAGLLLGFVYDVTKEPIANQQQLAKQEAYMAVFPEASSFSENQNINIDELNEFIKTNGFEYDSVTEVLNAEASDGSSLGYVFGLTSTEGYGGEIDISMGISNDGTVKGVEILSISETAGLGMKADTDEFKSQFAEKNVSRFSYTKTGKSVDYEIDAISGATITTNAMTNVVNSGIACFEKIGGGQ